MKTPRPPWVAAVIALSASLHCLPAHCQASLEGYLISPGDVLEVSVFDEEQLSGSYRVGPAGTLPMPLVGNIQVGGRRLDEVEEAIGTQLRRLIKRPVVTVALNELASERKVYVSGEVERPGPLVLPFGATVADAIASAGPLMSADLRSVQVTNSAYEPHVLDLSGLRSETPIPAFEPVRYGDVIHVSRLTDRIAVLGAVTDPGEMILPIGGRVTVLDAISHVGQGLTASADRTSALLIRPGHPTTTIDLRKLLQEGDLSENVELAPGDVVVVREAGRISVLGEVHTPATMEIGEPVKVLDALARAGSVTPDADLKRGQLITSEGAIPIDLEALLVRGEMQYNLTVNPGDVLLVPRAGPETVLILGAVGHSGVIDIRDQEQRDLLRLLTVAQPTELADLRHTYVYREDGRLVADMYAAIHEGDMSQNLALQPDDVVMVPELNTIYVMGASSAGGPVPLLPELTLYDVVSRFGNTPHGNLRQVTVMRTTEEGETEFIVRDMTGIPRGERPEDLTLQQGDVVFIPYRTAGIGWGDVRNALWALATVVGLLGL
ncbi:MAG: polysaccharide biosynthesis/export family protein [Armatimonadota bacterium]